MTPAVRKLGVAVALFSISCSIVGCGSGGPAAGFETPEACFEAMKSSLNDGDFGGFVDTMTDETHAMLSGVMVMMGVMAKTFSEFAAMGGPEAKAEFEKQMSSINSVLEKHGLDDDAMKELGKDADMGVMMQGPEAAADAMAKLSEAIGEKRDFLVDMFDTMSRLEGDDGPASQMGEMAKDLSGTLEELQIEGDSATAVIVEAASDSRTPIAFRKTETGWKAHIDMNAIQGGGGARPASDEEMPNFNFDDEQFNPESALDLESEEAADFELDIEGGILDAEEASGNTAE